MKLQISSSLTWWYKVVLPGVVVLFNIAFIFACVFYLPSRYSDFYIVVIPFSMITSTIFIWPLVQLKKVLVDEASIEIGEGNREQKVNLNQINDISRFAFYFFRITYNDGILERKILVMPKISEFVVTMGMGQVESFELLKRLVAKSKQM